MSLEAKSLEFGDFLLDLEEKVLLRNGERLAVNPKTFQLLTTLLEEPGRLVEKDRLIKTLWPDSFVEEANLAFTVSLLRRALDDNAQAPRFVETIPRRGYRFIADVREIHNGSNQTAARFPWKDPRWNGFRLSIFALIFILAVGIAFSGYWIAEKTSGGSTNTILSAPFAAEKLSINGKVPQAVISPDGKNIAYINGIEGQQSIWLRQLESLHSKEIIPPSDDFYYGLAYSPDGNYLYFARSGRQIRDMGIYRVSILGGIPTRIIRGSEGWMSISPDGSTISFVRCPYTADEFCSLNIADAVSGQNERKLASRPAPIRIGDNDFSPDGKTVAFAVGQSLNQANEFGLSEIEIETGRERELSTEKFFNIRNLTWLPDQKKLLIAASTIPTWRYRIWEISLPSGTARALTTDGEDYTRLSLNREADRLVSTQVKQDFRLLLLNREAPGSPQLLVDSSRAAFFPNGKIAFASIMSGNEEIWSINADGSGQRQLTNDPADDLCPVVSIDSKHIFFASNRTGSSQIWKMDADGSDQEQITSKAGGSPLFISPDGKWLYYHHGADRTLWRVSTVGGNTEELVYDRRAIFYAVSPDGRYIAYSERTGKERLISIASLPDGQIVSTFRTIFNESSGNDLVWTPDGKGVIYVSLETTTNNAIMLHSTDNQTETKIADMGADGINSVAVAPDGNGFAIVQGGWKHDAVLITGLR